MDQAAERIESLKAGIVSAAVGTTVFGVITVVCISAVNAIGSSNQELATGEFISRELNDLLVVNLNLAVHPDIVVQGGIAALSSFLFGVTYRYVVRSDQNLQLQAGAVLAFGLVRGLAQISSTWMSQPYWISAAQLTTSLLMFATAALLLDWLMHRGWLQRFKGF